MCSRCDPVVAHCWCPLPPQCYNVIPVFTVAEQWKSHQASTRNDPLHCQGSTKWLSWLSEITETLISHGNCSWKSRIKCPKGVNFTEINFCHRNKLLKQKKNSLTYTSFCQRKISVREEENSSENMFPSEKQVSVWVSVKETHFCHRKQDSVKEKSFFHRKKFLPQTKFSLREKKASVTEASC